MVKVAQITQDLLAFGLEKNIYRRVFYRFLKYFYPSQSDFGRACVENFYSTMARLNNFQSAQKNIDSYIKFEIDQLNTRHKLNFKSHIFLNRQVLTLLNTHDAKQLISSGLRCRTQFRFLHSSTNGHIVMLLKPKGWFKVESYTNKAFVIDGKLKCLSPGVQLYYSPKLELVPAQRQFYWCPIMGWAVFDQSDQTQQGMLIQGPHLRPHKFSSTLQAPYSDLFYAIKNIEKHFIDPASDPFYQKTLKKINQALQALHHRHPDAWALATEVLREIILAKNLLDPCAPIQNALHELKAQMAQTKQPLNPRHLML